MLGYLVICLVFAVKCERRLNAILSSHFMDVVCIANQTAKDILGVELAYRLIERVMNPSGTLLLEVCQGLWALHALKEKKASEALEMLDTNLRAEMDKMEATLEARLSVAGAATTSVQQMNANARREFQSNCGLQRQNLLTSIAWEFRQLLCVQQQVLMKLKVPGFEDGATVDVGALDLQARVCSYLHSAFFLRSRVGEEPHVNMLKGHLKSLQKERDQPKSPSPVPPSFASHQVPLPPLPPPPHGGYAPPQPVMGMAPPQDYGGYQGQAQMMGNQSLPPPPPPPYGNQQQQYPPQPPYYQ